MKFTVIVTTFSFFIACVIFPPLVLIVPVVLIPAAARSLRARRARRELVRPYLATGRHRR